MIQRITLAGLNKLFKEQKVAQKHLEASTQDWQRALKPGDYAVRLIPSDDNQLLAIFIEIFESEYPEDQYLFQSQPLLRIGRHYSILCKDGEVGTFNVGVCFRQLSKDDFDYAKSVNWDVEKYMAYSENIQNSQEY